MEDSRSLLEHFESEGKETVESVADELKTQINTSECVAIRGKNLTRASAVLGVGTENEGCKRFCCVWNVHARCYPRLGRV